MRGAAKLALMERMADEEARSFRDRVRDKAARKAAKLKRKLKEKGLVK